MMTDENLQYVIKQTHLMINESDNQQALDLLVHHMQRLLEIQAIMTQSIVIENDNYEKYKGIFK